MYTIKPLQINRFVVPLGDYDLLAGACRLVFTRIAPNYTKILTPTTIVKNHRWWEIDFVDVIPANENLGAGSIALSYIEGEGNLSIEITDPPLSSNFVPIFIDLYSVPIQI